MLAQLGHGDVAAVVAQDHREAGDAAFRRFELQDLRHLTPEPQAGERSPGAPARALETAPHRRRCASLFPVALTER